MKSDLSERETQTLKLAAEGYTDQAIAIRLGISLATVGTYWGRIRTKLGQFNRTELVANYIKAAAAHRAQTLRAENATLIHQLEELEAERNEISLFRDLFNDAPDAILVVDDNGMIRMANEAAATLFGHSIAELEAETIASLIPERYHGKHKEHRTAYLENPTKRAMGLHSGTTAVHKDGREFPVAVTLNAKKTEHGNMAIAILRPVLEG